MKYICSTCRAALKRPQRIMCLGFIAFVAAATWPSALAQSPASATSTPSKDALSESLALRAMTAMSSAATQLLDSTAVGTLTVEKSNLVSIPITLKSKGNQLTRSELQTAQGTRTCITNFGVGAIIFPDGHVQRLNSNNIVGQRVRYIPVLSLLAEYNSGSTKLSYVGTTTVRGSVADVITVSYSPVANASSAKFHEITATRFAVDQVSGLVTMMQYTSYPENADKTSTVQVFFSDYRQVAGVQVPFRQETYFDGNLSSTLILSSVEFNTGLLDGAFEIPR